MEYLVGRPLGLKCESLAGDAEWSVRFLGAPPLWVSLLLVFPLLAGFVLLVYRREARSVPPAARLAMGVLRFLALFVVVLMIYDPIVSVERTLTRRATVAVLVDDSLSMELRDNYAAEESKLKVARAAGLLDGDRYLTPEENERFAGLSRMDLVKRVLENRREAFLDALAKNYRVRVYAFSSGLKRDAEPSAIRPEGRLTKIGEALAEAAADLKGQPVAAFVLLSDGCENEGLPAAQAAAELGRRSPPVPVHAVGVGSPEPPRDIQVLNPEAEETILLGDEWEVAVTVRQNGYDLRNVELRLFEEDRILRERAVQLPDKEGTQREKLVFKPEKPGQYIYRIEVPVQEGEVIPDNNAVTVNLTVVDD
ncbi:MAG: hypothetical protein MUC63_02515, partial [Planctomycetes bacterium]|nr:hypothetical protein [Planctomycetota bacterium]